MDPPQPLFLAHIAGGYEFRNTIGIIKNETDYATMVLSPLTIEISFVNRDRCAIHQITINTQELMNYQYNIRDDDGNLVPEYPIAFDTNVMLNTTKGIGRRDGIRLYWLAGDNKINVQPIKTTTKDPNKVMAMFVGILTMEHMRYKIPDCYTAEPNVRVMAKDFAEICAQATSVKCSVLEIVGTTNSVTLKGILPNNTLGTIGQYSSRSESTPAPAASSNMSEIDILIRQLQELEQSTEAASSSSGGVRLRQIKTEDLMTVRIPIATVKALSKIHNISPPGTMLRFYFAEGNPTKIESPIGTYGLYTVGLRNGRN